MIKSSHETRHPQGHKRRPAYPPRPLPRLRQRRQSPFGLASRRKIFTRIESYPDYAIYLAEHEGEIVGTFALLIMDDLAHLGASEGIVENLVVHPQMQGRGIGRIMMKWAMEICTEASSYKLVLSSNIKRTSAHQFYESLGFEKYGYSFQVKIEH